MAEAAEMVADGWLDAGDVDLAAEVPQADAAGPGRSVLGLDLDKRSEAVAEQLGSRTVHSVRCSRADRAKMP